MHLYASITEGYFIMILFKRTLTLFLSLALISVSLGNVQAAVVSNDQVILKTQQVEDKATLLQAVQREDVQQQLSSMGVSTADVESRINQMTHEEIAQLNLHMAELPAGEGVLGTIVLIFIVLVITDVIGATDIFPFVHPVN
jgi:Mg2+ and Co2+ transporter CorA